MNFDTASAIMNVGKTLGAADLQLDEDGFACLATDDFEVCFLHEPSERTLLLFARISDLPSEPDAAFYALLLEGNFFTRETGGATLGIDEDRGWVLLSQALFLGAIDPADFEARVIAFIEATAYWVMKVTDYFEGDAQEPVGDLGSAPMTMQTIRG